jgi:serine/threonine protein kinase
VEARKLQPSARFDLPELRTIALSTLVAIESVHQAGFVHRDIKPANFALSSASEWTIIDFGLARQIINDDGTVMPERTTQGFRGSTVYASVAAHAGKDVGRKDDLWSWVYVLAELIDGSLPWRLDRQQQQEQQEQLEREEVAQQQHDIKEETYRKKQHCMSTATDLTTSVPLPGGGQLLQQRQQQLTIRLRTGRCSMHC